MIPVKNLRISSISYNLPKYFKFLKQTKLISKKNTLGVVGIFHQTPMILISPYIHGLIHIDLILAINQTNHDINGNSETQWLSNLDFFLVAQTFYFGLPYLLFFYSNWIIMISWGQKQLVVCDLSAMAKNTPNLIGDFLQPKKLLVRVHNLSLIRIIMISWGQKWLVVVWDRSAMAQLVDIRQSDPFILHQSLWLEFTKFCPKIM